ncbi:disulfide bond formation protein B [Chelatococcus sambhunathii]|uniref:Disulfide bond formation protein B n=1 Tax=Chelatococcus sambhunathii TaxID=363953 RepID=A0ABU1DDU4_9HYPH|nr:disulfide bond formation protein B [Chelatococcus sambhunathii]MDR4306286.1 disulfide bond formation protein B [Chelatococcus sambhunathii]
MTDAPAPIRSHHSSRVSAAALVIAVVAALTVGGALIFEHVFGYVPCMLCLWERWPYYLGAPLALLAALLAVRGNAGAARLLLVLVAILFLGGAALGAYHAGVEWSFWPGPTSCAGANAAPSSAGGLLEQMRTTRIVPCDRAAWRLFGVSLAGYSALISLGLVALALIGARRGRS